MRRIAFFTVVLTFACGVRASWYWPFGSDDGDSSGPRISELMEPATMLIDEASDLAAEGKIDKSVEKYRKALGELDRIERENPERAKGDGLSSILKTRRAYVNAAIDSLLLNQSRRNERPVAVSDTTELERRLAEEKGLKVSKYQSSKVEKNSDSRPPKAAKRSQASQPHNPSTAQPLTKRERAIANIANGDYTAAELVIGEMLAAKPNSAMALNLKAAIEMRQGKLDEAEKTLNLAISTNPSSPSAYYNLALLELQKGEGDKSSARRYYETSRAMGEAEDPELETMLK